MIDDRGDPNDEYIPNDTGRLFIDGNLLADRLSDAATDAGPGDADTTQPEPEPVPEPEPEPVVEPDPVPETDALAAAITDLEPLFGDFVMSIARFDGGFYSYSAPADASDVVDLTGDSDFALRTVSIIGIPMTCRFQDRVSYDYACFIEGNFSNVSFVFNMTEPAIGEGTAYICTLSTITCASFTEATYEQLALGSPTGDADVVINGGIAKRSDERAPVSALSH